MYLLIRANASSEIGIGHLMRCLALAQTCKENQWQVIFCINKKASILASRLISESIQVYYLKSLPGSNKDAQETSNLAKDFDCQWVVVDGYQFDAEYQGIIKVSGLKLLFIDDYGHAEHYYADIVLNQNISADDGLYTNRESYTQLLLGTRYTLLRQEFWQCQGWKRINPLVASKILVTMGGADPDNVTLKVIQALELVKVDGLEVIVVVGASNSHDEQLQVTAKESKLTIRIEKNVQNMPELMAWADVAITAGGSTCWELAFMGLPSLILVLAENQRAIAQQLHKLEIFITLGNYQDVSVIDIASTTNQLLLNINIRSQMSRLSQKLIDGQGNQRVVKYLKQNLLKLRFASHQDSGLLWEWANDSDVRAVSFSSEPINWEDHVKWFNAKLIDSNCIFYIAIDYNNIPIGQVRYDIRNNQAVISISIASQFRYQGYGSYLIKIAQEKLFKDSNVYQINAYIKPDNQTSIQVFTKVGFQSIGTTIIKGQQAVHLFKTR
ncbi:UDP-2,4-diacetamido-2,4,6-trideoxy-beta-L-altropyranose hydrolase [Cronbergia sp. UHCC 0137]|uniref:UDP-2,4-diacetamido-2,4, 6-trideoxy-beta-L-altropyranose hydrolase n=1 Tax=Cronbergia sp. UHCC 0137 TaxID=3110239 RepID=UPI002B1F2D43|nr:UDP-2,4-diacetamido-2,4,6-trideoxy-beta-L-altropyranose hydrolase [Cronbergia sp. UHCC 0137]MEA5616583.1 UDP-2,4-diacetamido-2,4,6-trideoxy-beta-L-altropyranose hydrolase [Cronbergia sp. UHCC 0137]